MADIFWYCGEASVRQTSPEGWGGCCAPVLLGGELIVFGLCDKDDKRSKHDVSFVDNVSQGEKKVWEEFDREGGIKVHWNG